MKTTGMNNVEIAKAVLETANTEMHVNDIARKAIEGGLMQGFSVEEAARKLSLAISTSVKRATSPFSRVKNAKGGNRKGIYRIKRARPVTVTSPIPEPEQVGDTGFVGKGGEYAVMSELLFRGFNVSLMSVDKGVDVVAANDAGKYFHIQVKTANQREGIYQFGIRRKSFDANHSGQTFYVFVLRRDAKCDFVVMPNSQIASFVALGIIKGAENLSVRISHDGKSRKYSLNNHDITIYVNKFGQIC